MSVAPRPNRVSPDPRPTASADDRRRVANQDNAAGALRPQAGFKVSWPVAGVLLLMAVESIISAFTYPYFSLALENVGLSNWLIGLNASLAGAGILFVGPFLPRLIVILGLPRFAAAMYALPFLCFAAIIAFDHIAVWFASRFVMGACFAALWATTEIWLNGVVDDRQRGRVMSFAMVLYTSSQFLGPLMISATGVEGILPFVAVMLPLAAGFFIAFTIRDQGAAEPEAAAGAADAGFGFREAFLLARSLIVASFLVGVASTAIYSLYPLFGVFHGLSDEGASTLVAVFGLGEATLVGVFGLLADRYGRWWLLRLCAFPTLLIAIAMPLAGSSIAAQGVVLFLAGGTLGGIYTLGLILIGQDFRGHRLAVVTTGFAMAYSAGAMVGATPIGYLIDLFDPSALPMAVAVSLVVLAYFVYRGEASQGLDAAQVGSGIQDNRSVSTVGDEGETVDVEQPEVGDLQMGDDRERKESDLEEWFLKRAAEASRGGTQRHEAGADRLERPEAHQPGKRKRKLRKHFAA